MLGAILKAVLITIEILSSVLLIGVILIQKSKSQGMGMAFGGNVGESIFGAQMGNVLTKTTVILAIVFFVNTTFLAMLYSSGRPSTVGETIEGAPAEVTPVEPQELQDTARPSPGDESVELAPGEMEDIKPESAGEPDSSMGEGGGELPDQPFDQELPEDDS